MLVCSAAADPAFEGASITYGMVGVPGAISSFNIFPDRKLSYETIGGYKALGICGSGLIDIISELLRYNIITGTGSFTDRKDNELGNRLVNYKNMKAFELVAQGSARDNRPILLTQKDVREVQLAIAAGINILLKEAGINFNEIANIYLAGGFGSFIDPSNACNIGLFPDKMADKIIKIGNGAGLGAKAYLLDKKQNDKVRYLLETIEYLELSLRKDFQDEFMKSMEF